MNVGQDGLLEWFRLMKIVADANIPFLEGRLKNAELLMLPASDIDADAVRDADGIITRTRTKCNRELLEGSNVKAIATATIGTDHIDLAWCRENGIAVRNAPGCNAPGVALYVWNSLLRGGFDPGRDTLGVIGCGNVGRIVTEWGKKLGAKVLVCDPPRKDAGHRDHDYLPMDEVLARSDAVTLHTPLTHSGKYPTYHMIGEEALKAFKPGGIFVNAARGEVTDTRALSDAVGTGKIRHAIIDTWEGEPMIDHRLLQLADVATTHIAGYSIEGKQRATRMALEAIHDMLGIEVITEGLQGPYKEPETLDPDLILSHYNPMKMTDELKAHPDSFESLRNAYPLHKEIL